MSSSSKVSRLSGNYGSENFNEMRKKYKEMISTLPNRMPYYHPIYKLYQYEGFWYYSGFLEAALCMQQNFNPQPSDIFLCTAPKTDTVGLSLLATHLTYTILPKSISLNNCKIIYICREPKDTFVSWWHFTHKIEAKNLEVPLITLDQAFKWFCQGKSGFGPYWDHVLGYWKASIEKPDRVFFFKYEDLKENTLGYVKKLAEFMGKPFSKEEQEHGVPQEIVAHCNFENLSNLEVNKSGMLLSEGTLQISNNVFYHKGEIGDWKKNYLMDDMAKLIDDITHDKFQSSGLTFPSSSACN
ncbi:hypothetical protein H5410_012072 [Solanum commersonii]|uniref:Sulfotransferase n=1 Tax=Solanum commersonii TaxID=4109 RepID=A0A9J6AQJ4_SOLCO|nr:hypothetical protein H5410_012072 [Solanum commersonii]